MVESPVKGHWQDCRMEISAPRAFWQGERGKKRAGSGRCGTEHGAVTHAYVERPRAVASGGCSRPPRNRCWRKVAARPPDNLPGVSMRWRSLHRYRANAPPGNIGVACGSLSQRPGRSRTATRCALPARFAVAAVTCWWPGQQVGRSVDCRNQSDGTCRERANSPSGCGSRRR